MNAPERLLELLESSARMYEDFSSSCEMEHLAVQAGDLPRLKKLMAEKEKLAVKLLAVNTARNALQEEIASAMKRNAADITLSEIAASPQGRALKAKLLSAGDRLNKAAKSAREKSDFGRRLIGRAMNTVVETIRYATALTGGETSTYSNAKTMGSKMRSGVMVARTY